MGGPPLTPVQRLPSLSTLLATEAFILELGKSQPGSQTRSAYFHFPEHSGRRTPLPETLFLSLPLSTSSVSHLSCLPFLFLPSMELGGDT